MADEAEQVEQENAATLESSLAEFQQQLNAAPDEEQVEETAQAEGVEESAEGDSVGDEAAEEQAEVADEGPSFLMKRAAVEAGIDPALVGRAESDAQLQLMIEAAGGRVESEVAPKEDFTLSLELPEEEFGADDPVRKQFASWQEKLNKKQQEIDKALSALTTFANSQLDREEQNEWQSLYTPFDKALDSFESPLLGTSGKLTDKQRAERAAIASKYTALGATSDMPAEELQRYAELAVSAARKELIEQRTKKQQATAQQKRQVLGGGGAQRGVQPARTMADDLADWNKSIRTGVPLPN